MAPGQAIPFPREIKMSRFGTNPVGEAFDAFKKKDDGVRFKVLVTKVGTMDQGTIIRAADLGPGAEVDRLVEMGAIGVIYGGAAAVGEEKPLTIEQRSDPKKKPEVPKSLKPEPGTVLEDG